MAGKYKVAFDFDLLSHIYFCDNNKAKSMLSKNLVNAYDDYGTLLHYAAEHGNATIARHLIELGAEIDCLGQDGKTPLMVAVNYQRPATIQVLLEAGANVDIVNADGNSILETIFDGRYVVTDILRLFLKRVKPEAISTEELVAKLTAAGCNLFHAAHFNDFDVIKLMLEHGVDVDSRGYHEKTALYAAVELNDLDLASWLINNGADVNALDIHGKSALFAAAWSGNVAMIQMLLEKGADPNFKTYETEETPLFAAAAYALDPADVDGSLELLLQAGAVPCNPVNSFYSIFDHAMVSGHVRRANYFTAQLALLEKMGKPIDKSVMYCTVPKNQAELDQLFDYYKLCELVLEASVFRTTSLFTLLTQCDDKIRVCVRNETFVPTIEKTCPEMSLAELYPYYCSTLMKRISKARRAVELEDRAIPVICEMFEGNYNQCYNFARKVVGYLNERDLERLVQA